MIKGDVGEDDNPRVEDIGRIESATETRLDNRDIDPGAGELGERGRGQRFELRRADPLRGGAHASDRGVEAGILASHLDPLAPTGDVRRRVRADEHALAVEERSRAARCGRLAVRSHDVDRRAGALRLAELGQQGAHPSQPELLGPGRERLDPLSL